MGRLDDRLGALRVAEADAPALPPVTPEADLEAGAPVGPSADEEAALLVTQRRAAIAPPLPAPREEPPSKLPPLEGLVARVPVAVREALDDLFRAKFTVVRRVPPSALK